MQRIDKLDVYYHEKHVGTLALYQKRLAAFEYSYEWLAGYWKHRIGFPILTMIY